ncbi:MAG: carotenoid biosynthesis protein [Nocardia sp.]|nr:carotenoid biosynthesis protein [Nocardia sp.]
MIKRRGPAIAALAWVLAQIAYPLTSGTERDVVTVVVVALSAATALWHAGLARGPIYAAGYVVIVAGLGLTVEIIGTGTGFPFGCYHYAPDRLGPAVAGVPLMIALAWAGGLYPVWVAATMLYRRAAVRIVATAAGAVGWDLYLDPQMVADGRWRWCSALPGLPGPEPIPYTNYLGWFAVGAVMAAALLVWERRFPAHDIGPEVPIAVLAWTWLGSALAHAAFLGLPYSALYGWLGLGTIALPATVAAIARPIRAHHPAPRR